MPVKNGFQSAFEISNFYESNNISNYNIAAHSAAWDNYSYKILTTFQITVSLEKGLRMWYEISSP